MKLRTILIDDDPSTIEATEIELQLYCPNDIVILKTCTRPADGMQAIRELKPDLVLLDVEMPTFTGIQVVEILRGEGLTDFDVVFTTAHEEFSLKAFELNALHYLLKPYRAEQLVEAINRAKTKRAASQNNVTLAQVEVLIQQAQKPKTLRISTREGIEFLLVTDILYVQADANYAVIFLASGGRRTVSCPLKEIERQLVTLSSTFQRAHQSYLINLDFLQSVRADGSLILRGCLTAIPVSRVHKSNFALRVNL